MREEILKLLRETNGYLSGQAISEKLGVSRTAVWKIIQQLKREGYEIESVQNRGYLLHQNDNIWNKEEITNLLTTDVLGRSLYFFDKIDSTNLEIRRLQEKGASHGTVAVADEQTAGMGSRGRSWNSPKGSSIFMSILLQLNMELKDIPKVTLVAGYSIAQALKEVSGEYIQIKWPNDIILNRKKLVGILTQMFGEPDSVYYEILGIGINANNTSFPEDIADKGTSLYLETGRKFSRAKITAVCLKYLEENLDRFTAAGNLSFLVNSYNDLLVNRDERVRIERREESFEATALGIDNEGALLVRKDDDTVERVYSGEVSVRGLYSYV